MSDKGSGLKVRKGTVVRLQKPIIFGFDGKARRQALRCVDPERFIFSDLDGGVIFRLDYKTLSGAEGR